MCIRDSSCLDIRSLVKQPFGLGRGSFGERPVDRAVGMDERGVRFGLRLIGTRVTDGRESENEKQEGAGNAGAVVQAKHGSPTRQFKRLSLIHISGTPPVLTRLRPNGTSF